MTREESQMIRLQYNFETAKTGTLYWIQNNTAYLHVKSELRVPPSMWSATLQVSAQITEPISSCQLPQSQRHRPAMIATISSSPGHTGFFPVGQAVSCFSTRNHSDHLLTGRQIKCEVSKLLQGLRFPHICWKSLGDGSTLNVTVTITSRHCIFTQQITAAYM